MNLKTYIENNERKVQRILEILPGFSVWMIILFPFWMSIFWPELVAFTVLAFMVFWLYRSLTLGSFSIRGYLKIKEYRNTDWRDRYETDEEKEKFPFQWEDVNHIVIIPNYNEPIKVLRRSLDSLADQEIAKEQLLVILAMEERAEGSEERAEKLKKEYQDSFKLIFSTHHPPDLPGEVPGKSSNERWAALKAKEKLIESGEYEIEKLTLTSCDADARFHPKYFSCLTYKFLKNKNRYLRFWQSILFEHNNIDEVPALIRIVSILGGSFHLFDAQEPRRLLINYSSYSTSFKLLDKVGYWDPDVIPEDWHIFLKSFFSQRGEVEVRPIFLPTYLDAPLSKTYVGSLINRYKQCKRHAWGVTLVPYVVLQFIKHPEIPLLTRLMRVYKVVESQILWSTSWFFVTLAATIPPLINPAFEQTVLGQNLPRIAGNILSFSLITLFITIVVDAKLRPPSLKEVPLWKKPLLYLEWFMLPIATLFMAALPGLHSQTQLMFGKYMNYQVTEKV